MLRYAADDVYADLRSSLDSAQRIAEGHTLDMRFFLRRYETVLESQRLAMLRRRQEALHDAPSERERLLTLSVIDELWSDYLVAATECRSNTVWVSLGAGNPFGTYLKQLDTMFWNLDQAIEEEGKMRRAQPLSPEADDRHGGETWTYLTVDEPFGAMTERILRGLRRPVERGCPSPENLAGCGKTRKARDNARPAAAEWAIRGPRGAAAGGSGRSPV